MSVMTPIPSKIALLIPRLASDADGEIVATVRAIDRQLRAAGLDFHDLVSRLTSATEPEPMQWTRPDPAEPSLFDMASWLRFHALDRLTDNQRDFIVKATGILGAGRHLSEKQAAWLRNLYDQHGGL
ncbi:hypothetical protein [Cereibacter azotoformans]|uniref:Uncharacterized protein n=1 Tax=Cereibacter azotoformans TaxID=43057 RepID=A0A2T5JY11_9RHOB|nr:hypothetical protein [Cereibacter azotoformans]MBO4169692.1 hypothetical protein [Cereibacter azotoformans]PTR14968.1 hypothetical protein C8J28_115113 [Cereibacter azotoformans]